MGPFQEYEPLPPPIKDMLPPLQGEELLFAVAKGNGLIATAKVIVDTQFAPEVIVTV